MLKITSPFHGAILNWRHGRQDDKGLWITVTGTAPVEAEVTVNGETARRDGLQFIHAVCLRDHDNTIVAVSEDARGISEHGIRVVWDRASVRRYRVAIDDTLFCLRDLARTRPDDIFSCFYLDMLRRLHRRYGTRFSCNLFYASNEGDFNLSQMPDRWKRQFADQADWLKFTWHAYSEFPDRPYQFAEPEKVAADYDLIQAEVCRFAGAECFCPPTIVHWYGLHPSALPALRDRGVRALSGYYVREKNGFDLNNGLDHLRSSYLANHDMLMDYSSGLILTRTDLIINKTPAAEIIPSLQAIVTDHDNAEFVDLLTHEQYFWPFYFNYLPDHEQRMDLALNFLTEQGYRPVWMHEGFLGV